MDLFVSDIHLSTDRPEVTARFLAFLRERAVRADRLFILGDLFEAWLGDDCVLPEYRDVVTALRELTDAGVAIAVQRGNRDFLLGGGFEQMTGCKLLTDAEVVEVAGAPTLLMHGDTLCTDDIRYQAMREQLRDPAWIAAFLDKTADERVAFARELRAVSEKETGGKDAGIMDVNRAAVERAMHDHQVTRLIHGHTHRPDCHKTGGLERWVLSDWTADRGNVLVADEAGLRSDPA